MAEIVLDRVTKSYPDGATAVKELSITIADGEFVILVGPSGCGKTTTLNMIAGLEDISSGELRIDGKRVNEKAPKDRDIAMVFQSYALYPHMTVRQNIAFPLTLAKKKKAEIAEKVEEIARILDLTDLLDRKPSQLSGGQRQRVAMGRAIVRQPKAFLMDEPLSNLDAKLRVQMRAEIARLQRRLGTTTVYVTHDQTEAMTLGTRVAVLSGGVLQQVAPPTELYRRPANLFVAGFIGSPPMNLIDARLERGDGGPLVVFGPHRLRVPPSVLAGHSGLDRYLGEPVVVGIRPEHLADAALAGAPPAGPAGGPAPGGPAAGESVIELPISLREELGSEVHLHATIGAAAHAGAAGDGDDVRSLATIVARADPRSRIAEGTIARLVVDAAELHFSDPATGASIRDG